MSPEQQPATYDQTSQGPRHGTVSPAPLPPELIEAPALPPGLLPEPLHPWLYDIAERMQIPLEFVAAPAVVALSSVIGRSVGIYPKRQDDWLVVPNLWGVIVGRPGVQKSPAIMEPIKPLRRLAQLAQIDFEAAGAAAKAKIEILKLQMETAKQDAKVAVKKGTGIDIQQGRIAELTMQLEQAAPKERRYLISDATVEKIGELLRDNPRGLLLYRDELVGMLRSLDKLGREAERAFFLEAWNGAGGFDYDRIGRGTLHIPALTLSIIGGMTPGKLRSYLAGALEGGAQDDGLLQRFQVAVWPEVGGDWKNVDRHPNTEAKSLAFDIFRALDNLDPAAVGAVDEDGEIPALRFAPDAQDLFDEYRARLELRLRSGELKETPAFESHLAKYRSLMPSLALIFHLVAVVTETSSGPVSLEAAKLAADWCDYLEQHARKIYSPELQPDVTAAHRLAAKIKAGDIQDGQTVREIYRCQWSGLTNAEPVYAGLGILIEYGWVRMEHTETGGRPSDVLHIHPDLRKAS